MEQNNALLHKRIWMLALLLPAVSSLSGCLVAGVSSNGGWFIWPGSFGLLFVFLVLFLLLRRRR